MSTLTQRAMLIVILCIAFLWTERLGIDSSLALPIVLPIISVLVFQYVRFGGMFWQQLPMLLLVALRLMKVMDGQVSLFIFVFAV